MIHQNVLTIPVVTMVKKIWIFKEAFWCDDKLLCRLVQDLLDAFSSTCCPICWQLTFRDATSGFPAKGRLRNGCRNSTLMTCHYPDLGGTSYWMEICFNQSIRSTSKVWAVTHHQYQISAIIPQASFWGTRGDIAKWWLFCQATESSNKNILKNSKKCFFRPQPLKHKWLLSSEVMSVSDRVLVMDFMKSILCFIAACS